MAITTITDCSAMNRLLRWLLPSLDREHGFGEPVTEEQARSAAIQLADASAKTLGAGIRGQLVAIHWNNRAPRRRPGAKS